MAEEAGRSRAPRWMRVTLAASLAVNLLVAGLVLGVAISHGGRDGRPGLGRHDGGDIARDVARDLVPAPFLHALRPEDRTALAERFHAEAEPLHAGRDALRERFEALLAALRAEPFDRAEVGRLLTAQRRAAGDRHEIGERVILDHLAAMDPDERRAFADRLDRSLRRGPRR